MSLKIHAFPASPRSFKVLAVARQLGVDHEFVLCDIPQGAQRRPEFAVLNPNRKVPVLEDGEFRLWESNAIAHYLATLEPQGNLLPGSPQAHADMLRWMLWDATTWDPACSLLIFEHFVKPLLRKEPADTAEVQKGLQKFHAAAAILDEHLDGRSFVCGEHITVADFCLGASLIATEAAQLPVARYPRIARWAAALASQPGWRAALALLPA